METFRVKVLGSEYSVKADSGGDHVKQVARIVDGKMKEITEQFSQGSPTRTAVVACMNLVDDHLTVKRQDAEWIRRRVGSLINKIDSVI